MQTQKIEYYHNCTSRKRFVNFHELLNPVGNITIEKIKAKKLTRYCYDDHQILSKKITEFPKEMMMLAITGKGRFLTSQRTFSQSHNQESRF